MKRALGEALRVVESASDVAGGVRELLAYCGRERPEDGAVWERLRRVDFDADARGIAVQLRKAVERVRPGAEFTRFHFSVDGINVAEGKGIEWFCSRELLPGEPPEAWARRLPELRSPALVEAYRVVGELGDFVIGLGYGGLAIRFALETAGPEILLGGAAERGVDWGLHDGDEHQLGVITTAGFEVRFDEAGTKLMEMARGDLAGPARLFGKSGVSSTWLRRAIAEARGIGDASARLASLGLVLSAAHWQHGTGSLPDEETILLVRTVAKVVGGDGEARERAGLWASACEVLAWAGDLGGAREMLARAKAERELVPQGTWQNVADIEIRGANAAIAAVEKRARGEHADESAEATDVVSAVRDELKDSRREPFRAMKLTAFPLARALRRGDKAGYVEAVRVIAAALQKWKGWSKSKLGLVEAYADLAVMFWRAGDLAEMRRAFGVARTGAEREKDSGSRHYDWSRISKAYEQVGDLDEAMACAKRIEDATLRTQRVACVLARSGRAEELESLYRGVHWAEERAELAIKIASDLARDRD